MTDIVTSENEALYREAFCATQGHTMECVRESVIDMANVLACVCHTYNDVPTQEVTQQIELEVFQHHLVEILRTKDCNCKH